MNIFRFWRYLNFSRLRQLLDRVSQQKWLSLPVQVVSIIILTLFQVLWNFLKILDRRIANFFQFFEFLNWTTVKTVFGRAGEQRLPGLAAEMAYNAMLAFFPAILAFLAAIALFEPLQTTLYQMAQLLSTVVPDDIRHLARNLINQIMATRSQELFSLSFIGSLWAFSGVLSAAMAALDRIHQVPSTQTRPFWKAKLISLGLTLGTIILLILASGAVFISDLVVQAIARQSCLLEAIKNCELENPQNCLLLPIPNCPLESHLLEFWGVWRWPIVLGIVSVAFAFIYRFGPSYRRPQTPILPGAVLAALFWAQLSYLFRLYVANFGHYNWTYGTVGTFIILLLWLNLSSLVLLVGEQINVTVGEAMNRKNW